MMTRDLEFRPPIAAPRMPVNYLPAALGALCGVEGGPGRILYLVQDRADDSDRKGHSSPPAYGVLSRETLARPDLMAARTTDLLGGARVAGEPQTFLGPPTRLRQDVRPRPILVPEVDLAPDSRPRRALVVVDAGIAFWNQRFRGNGTRFQGVAFPEFSAQVQMLGPAAIEQIFQMAEGPDGDRQVLERLGADFPGSHFGRWRDVQGFWHGTAVADLADDGEVALFGVELPRAAVEDRSGDSLTAIMPLVIQAALALTGSAKVAALPLDIVLPYAFTGGPHDGSHPVAAVLANLLAAAEERGRRVRLFLPAGNHRQDACHAVLAGGAAEAVDWHLPPDDYSSNTVEIVIPGAAGEPVLLGLAAPGGGSAEVPLRPEQVSLLALGGEVIGAIVRGANQAGSARLRLALSPTAAAEIGSAVAPAGRWSLRNGSMHRADLWILRDDRFVEEDGPWPRRGSRFGHPGYADRDEVGRWRLDDPLGAVVRRAGTISAMATARGNQVVSASVLVPQGAPRPAHYSGLRADGQPTALTVPVDALAEPEGQPCLGNGTSQRFRMSGTSAAVALAARDAT